MLYKEETYEGRNDAGIFYSPLLKDTTMSVNVIAPHSLWLFTR